MPETDNHDNRGLALSQRTETRIMHTVFLVALIGSAVFYRDRLLGDLSYYLWNFTAARDFAIFHNRWPNVLVQWPAILAVKMAAPLWLVAAAYSTAYTGLYYGVALLLRYALKAPKAAAAFTLFFVAATTHCFIWPIDELANGIALLFLAGPLLYGNRPWVRAAAVFAVILTACFFHALAIGVAVYLLVFHALGRKDGVRIPPLIAAAAAILAAVAERVFWSPLEYEEAAKIDLSAFREHAVSALRYASGGALLPMLLVLAAACAALWLARRRLQLALLLVAALGFGGVVVARYHFGNTFWVYLWHILTPLFAFPLLALAGGKTETRPPGLRVLLGVCAAALLVHAAVAIRHDVRWLRMRQARVLRMANAGKPEQRLHTIDGIARQQVGPFSWSVGDESLILTSLDGPENARMAAPEPPLRWHTRWSLPVNPAYFALPEKLEPEMFIPLNSSRPAAWTSEYAAESVLLECEAPALAPGEATEIPVTIRNRGEQVFPSRSDAGPVGVATLWVVEGRGRMTTPNATLLEVDVHDEYTLPVRVQAPDEELVGELYPVFVIGGKLVAPASAKRVQ